MLRKSKGTFPYTRGHIFVLPIVMKAQISLLVAFLYLSYAANVTSHRSWPVWGHDNQHSRFQSETVFDGSLCGADNVMSFPTSSSQAVVDEGGEC